MPNSGEHNTTKRDTSRKLIEVFFSACKVGFPFLGVALIAALIAPFCVRELPAKVLTAKLAFTALGLLFSILQVFLGILLALIGVTIDYDIDASVGPAKVKLASASPGILLLIIGNLLFGFSLMRQFEASTIEKQQTGADLPAASVGSADLKVPALNGAKGPE